MRAPIGLVFLVVLTACAERREEAAAPAAPPPPAPTNWIEVPLAENAFREEVAGYRQDTLSVTVAPGPGLEVNLGMKSGAAIVYTWNVTSPSGAVLTSEFHGHTERVPGEPGTLMYYRKAAGASETGSLVAPFDGVHAWYFRNDSSAPVVVRLVVAGFYELLSTGDAIVRLSLAHGPPSWVG